MGLTRLAALAVLLTPSALKSCPRTPPIIESFTATPETIAPGESSLLAWRVTGALRVSLDQGIGPVTGTTHSVTPVTTTTYTLTAANLLGTTTATVRVVVAQEPNTWRAVAPMPIECPYPLATLLLSGEPLVVCDSSALLFDPVTEGWTPTSPRSQAGGVRATLLRSGQVLVTGSDSSAELYDPASGTWTPTGSMTRARPGHTATLLASGTVLAAGGPDDDSPEATPTAELYDPGSGTWSETGSMAIPRQWHTATLLPTGQVLVTGGLTIDHDISRGSELAELYDPGSATWILAGSLPGSSGLGPTFHTATLLPSAQVLVVGGDEQYYVSLTVPSVSSYDVAAGTWSRHPDLLQDRAVHTATLLRSGRVLVVGGSRNGPPTHEWEPLATTELIDPESGSSSAAALSRPRAGHQAILLPSGDVLVVDGGGAEIYRE